MNLGFIVLGLAIAFLAILGLIKNAVVYAAAAVLILGIVLVIIGIGGIKI